MIRRYEFEGEQRTFAEIQILVPRLGKNAIRAALAAGRNTRVAMLAYDPGRVSAAATRKAYAKRGKPAILSAHVSRDYA